MRWLDGVIMDPNLSGLWQVMKRREAWRAARRVRRDLATPQRQHTHTQLCHCLWVDVVMRRVKPFLLIFTCSILVQTLSADYLINSQASLLINYSFSPCFTDEGTKSEQGEISFLVVNATFLTLPALDYASSQRTLCYIISCRPGSSLPFYIK